MADSPQAVTVQRRTAGHFLKGAIDARDLSVEAPRIVVGNDGVATEVFKDEEFVGRRFLQNCCVYPVKYAVNSDVAADSFHGILAGCSAEDDGLGSVVDLTPFKGKVTAMATGGAMRVSTFLAYTPERVAA